MKKSIQFFAMIFISFSFLGCDPLDKKYSKENYTEVLKQNADSVSQSAFQRAIVENEINDVRNEDFTYQELINQGKLLQKRDLPNNNVSR
ncbi:hypothetical protein [Larkinella rosea]|uniref:Lipoprotein n=1 Tax=Larkinella rosea TaxID=2025312 RepID=A0A3P1C142_9BACT|nr:hypothetical protein [Larkinella rosea]RRB07115.1 hypothetical protein EHT25_04850 [Larkinella rosea]